MSIPNGGLITETNRQYYEGAQNFVGDGVTVKFTTTFNTNIVFYSFNPAVTEYDLNNFKIYISLPGSGAVFNEFTGSYTVVNNTFTFDTYVPLVNEVIVVQLKTLKGGNYGNRDAYGNTVEENYGGYQYIKLVDIVNNFMMAYVGNGKLVPSVKRTDVVFHAKRGLQELSYDTLRSVKAQELTVPPSLSVVIPQDFVNYVKISWVDGSGVKHPMYPANNLTSNPSESPVQDGYGVAIQDEFNENITSPPIIEERWRDNNQNLVIDNPDGLDYDFDERNNNGIGALYGLDPQYANKNGWFTINDRENKISFSSNLSGAIVVIDYVSDGLSYDLDSRLPKMAEEAMYAHVLHAVVASKSASPEYLVRRLVTEKNAKVRNAKIRLSNIKLEELTQVMRGKSKQIKH